MVTWLALLLAALVSVIAVNVGYREWRQLRRRVRALAMGIELRTRDDPSTRHDPSMHHDPSAAHPGDEADDVESDSELATLLDDALGENDGPSALLAVHELESMGRLAVVRVRDYARAAGRVPFLSGIAAAIVVVALDGAERSVLMRAGALLGGALVGSLVASFFCQRARGAARKFSELCEELARQVEARWAVSQVSPPVNPGPSDLVLEGRERDSVSAVEKHE